VNFSGDRDLESFPARFYKTNHNYNNDRLDMLLLYQNLQSGFPLYQVGVQFSLSRDEFHLRDEHDELNWTRTDT
jgi:hypothetical protein